MAETNGNGKKEKGTTMCGDGCCCGSSMGMHHHGFGYAILRVIIALIVLGIVFSAGVLMGELRAFVGGFSHRGAMMGGYGSYGMMGGVREMIPSSTAQ